jgi:hypothetical protein
MAKAQKTSHPTRSNVTKTQKSFFFDLPLEIRLMIYHFANILSHGEVYPRFKCKRLKETQKPGRILRVSKAFSQDLAPLIYGEQKLFFSSLFEGVTFMNLIGDRNASYLCYIHMATFRLKYTEARDLRLEYVESLPAISKYIAFQCPNIRALKVGDVSPGIKLLDYGDQMEVKDWSIKTLERLKSLIETLSQLSKIT